MSTSRGFCHRCSAEVADTGGFCLLGHRLSALPGDVPPPPPPPPAMGDLHEGVERTFEEAQAKVAAAMPSSEKAAPARSRYVSSVEATWAELEAAPAPAADDPINTFAPPPRMDWGPQRPSLRSKLRRARTEAPV
ncbi:MAG: hypothetical protein M3271_06160 [Actinomycetota bacterium]|nr:hypothetical protein [Actinomycetota bacterium]